MSVDLLRYFRLVAVFLLTLFVRTVPGLSDFEFRNALLLSAQLNTLAYAHPDCGMASLGLIFEPPRDIDSVQSHFCIGLANRSLYVIVEGTSSPEQWLANLDLKEELWNKSDVYLLSGFKSEADRLYSAFVKPIISKHHKSTVYFSGHSRGGSIAQILHLYAHRDFPKTELYSFSFGGPPALSAAPHTVMSHMWSFRHDQDIVPLLSIPAVARLFCDVQTGKCQTLNLVNLASGLFSDKFAILFKALRTQKDTILTVLETYAKSRVWHVKRHIGHKVHLRYWQAPNGTRLGRMPISADEVNDFLGNSRLKGGHNILYTLLENLRVLTPVLGQHQQAEYFEFLKSAPVLLSVPWLSRLPDLTEGIPRAKRPNWIPAFSNGSFTKKRGPFRNSTLYVSAWSRCMQRWDGITETMECHLPGLGCAARGFGPVWEFTFVDYGCWVLNFAGRPVWLPDYAEKCLDAKKGICQLEDGVECNITRDANHFMADCRKGDCKVAINTNEATGESFYFKQPGGCESQSLQRSQATDDEPLARIKAALENWFPFL
jgi:hypothetical protein